MDEDQPRYGCCNALLSQGHSIACQFSTRTVGAATPPPERMDTDDEPAPVPNKRAAIQDLVIADLVQVKAGHLARVAFDIVPDMVQRKKEGIAKYGTPLQAFNGRDAGRDAYQEAIDLVQYSKQKFMECQEDHDYKGSGLWGLTYTKAVYLLCEIKEAIGGET